MNFKNNLIILIVTIATIFACNAQKKKDVTEDGLVYHYHTFGEGVKADTGDIVTYHYELYSHKDSLIDETWSKGPIQAMARPVKKKGSLEQMIFHFTEGDSLSVKIKTDSFFGGRPMPPFLEKGTDLRWEVSVIKVQTKEDYDKELADIEAQQKVNDEEAIVKHIESIEGNFKQTESGLFYNITQSTEGVPVKNGDMISVHYTGMLLDGKQFDSSIPRGKPISFKVGEGQVIPGWDEGLLLLKEGEKAELLVPSYLAYGVRGAGNGAIAPNTVLKFELEVVSIFDAEKQKTIDDEAIQGYMKENKLKGKKLESGLYVIKTEKTKDKQAEAGKKIAVHYTGTLLDGTKFDSSVDRGTPFEFNLGGGQVIKGWDEGIAQMNVGEKAILLIPSHLGYGTRGGGEKIPANTVLKFEVELLEIKE